MPFEIISRSRWGAERTRSSRQLMIPAKHVMISYSGNRCYDVDSCCQEVFSLQRSHLASDRLMADIKYNFLIGGDGRVYTGRGWKMRPAVPYKWGSLADHTLHIAYLGDFSRGIPPDVMIQAQNNLLKFGVEKRFLSHKFMEYTLKRYYLIIILPAFQLTNQLLGFTYNDKLLLYRNYICTTVHFLYSNFSYVCGLVWIFEILLFIQIFFQNIGHPV